VCAWTQEHGRDAAVLRASRYIGEWVDGFIQGSGQMILGNRRVVKPDWKRMSFVEAVESVRKHDAKLARAAERRRKRLFGVWEAIYRAEEVERLRDELEVERAEKIKAEAAERRRMLIERRQQRKKAAISAVEQGLDPRAIEKKSY